MNKDKVLVKNESSIGEKIFRFFIGFLIPYLAINGIIFFVFIQTPKINVVDAEANNYEQDKIKFSVDCLLPLQNIKVLYQDNEISYSKLGDLYTVDIVDNGSYQIKVTAINKAVASTPVTIETKDSIPPTVDLDSAVITGNTLIVSIHDNESEINYDNLFATLEDGTKVEAKYVDKVSGTVRFQVDNGNKIIVHVEDEFGNSSETSFTIS